MAHTARFKEKVLKELKNGATAGYVVKKFKVNYGTIASWRKTETPVKAPTTNNNVNTNKLAQENMRLKAFIFDKVYGGVVNENRN